MNIITFLQESNITVNHYRYTNFIFSRPIRNKIIEEGYELHHIIPKSLGGEDTDNNIIKLTYREHYIAHLILWKCGYQKMAYAFWRMNNNNKNYGARLSSRQYEQLREDRSRTLSEGQKGELNHQYGKHHSEEWKRKVSEKLKGRLHSPESYKRAGEKQRGEKNHMYGKKPSKETIDKITSKTRGQKRTEEQRQHLREGAAKADRSYLETESWKTKQSKAHKDYLATHDNPFLGKKHSEESKKKMSESQYKRQVYCLETQKSYKSLVEAAKEVYGDRKYFNKVRNSIIQKRTILNFTFVDYKQEEQENPAPPEIEVSSS
ncbi:MAG TPA: NUMOD3 domain-containing DNA-binding protein [Candidatus Dojkabacteria bacterium]|nr:NUMOD3 domain-containing DNA-binding protein [Candidatus Dojkabacteria bacterium]